MNRKSEKAVNDAIQYLTDVMEETKQMEVINDATQDIKILQEALDSSSYERKYHRK